MRSNLHKPHRRTLTAGILLVAFAVRALIPPGFMPATDRPFSIEICWEGLPAGVLARGGPPHADSTGMDSTGMDSTGMDSMDMDSMPAHPMQGAHHHHSGSSSHSEHCVFGTACSAGPILHLPLPSELSSTRQPLAVAFVSIAGAVRLVHLPQPRAPPGRLS
jgi:hypothetical protein